MAKRFPIDIEEQAAAMPADYMLLSGVTGARKIQAGNLFRGLPMQVTINSEEQVYSLACSAIDLDTLIEPMALPAVFDLTLNNAATLVACGTFYIGKNLTGNAEQHAQILQSGMLNEIWRKQEDGVWGEWQLISIEFADSVSVNSELNNLMWKIEALEERVSALEQ